MLTPEEVVELFELRGVLEPWLAERAATRRTPEDLSRLRDELASMPAVPSGQGYEDYRELANHE